MKEEADENRRSFIFVFTCFRRDRINVNMFPYLDGSVPTPFSGQCTATSGIDADCISKETAALVHLYGPLSIKLYWIGLLLLLILLFVAPRLICANRWSCLGTRVAVGYRSWTSNCWKLNDNSLVFQVTCRPFHYVISLIHSTTLTYCLFTVPPFFFISIQNLRANL